jgi:hypothetical protein
MKAGDQPNVLVDQRTRNEDEIGCCLCVLGLVASTTVQNILNRQRDAKIDKVGVFHRNCPWWKVYAPLRCFPC